MNVTDPVIVPIDETTVDRDPVNGHMRLTMRDPVARGVHHVFWLTDAAAAQISDDVTGAFGDGR